MKKILAVSKKEEILQIEESPSKAATPEKALADDKIEEAPSAAKKEGTVDLADDTSKVSFEKDLEALLDQEMEVMKVFRALKSTFM